MSYYDSLQGFQDEDQISAEVNWVDYLAIGIYFVLIIAVGIWTSRVKNNVENYFLAGRSMHWLPVGASLFASNLGAEHFVGLTGSGATGGIGVGVFEYTAMAILLALGWFFMPVYLASNISTMPEYLRLRFGGQRIRVYLSLLALILYIFTKISACLFAGSLFIKLLLNLDNIYLAVVILLVVSAIFTIIGGLNTVIWTDFLQVFIMIIGSIALLIISLVKLGGYGQLMEQYRSATPTNASYEAFRGGCDPLSGEANSTCESCSAITPYYKHMFRPVTDPEVPWPGILGATISGIWYWCTDQVIVQRGLSARNISHAKAGCVFASLLKVLPVFILVIPGMAARILWPNQIGCSDPDACERVCGSTAGCTNMAYPYLVVKLMPVGATGVMVSVILAALMSSLSSIFNSASTIFIIDIYTLLRKRASEAEQVIVGRVFVVALVVVSVIWIPILEASNNSQLFQYIQSVTSFFSPPVCAIYLLAIFWERTNEPGAFWALVVGLIIGAVRMVLEFAIPAPACFSSDPDERPTFVSKLHYLHFGVVLFTITILVAVVVSLLTEKPDKRSLYRLTFSTVHSEQVRQQLDENQNKDDHDEHDEESIDKENSTSAVNKWVAMVCCAAQPDTTDQAKQKSDQGLSIEKQLTPEEVARLHADYARDDPRMSPWINASCVGMVIVCAFFWGYYA